MCSVDGGGVPPCHADDAVDHEAGLDGWRAQRHQQPLVLYRWMSAGKWVLPCRAAIQWLEQTIDGTPVNGISPRLSVFRKVAGRSWLIVAHAHFAPIAA
jgi:hypothetical protein